MKNNSQNTTAFEGVLTPKSLTYPKSTDWLSLQPGDFTIFKATIDDIDNSTKLPFEITGDWPPPYHDITFKGRVPSLLPGVQYKFKARLVADPKWGNQFSLVTLDRIKELSDAGETELFMSVLFGDSIFTKLKEGLGDELLEVFKDTQERIKRLIKIKGIGKATANKICALYDLNVPYYKDYTVLHSKYGLTMLAINKLKEKFGSTEAVINVLEINPYTLMLVDGYGWAKCDKLALSNGYNPLGEFRVGAFIKYYLEEQAETEGHSWILLDDLLAAIKKEIGDVNLKLLQMWLRTWTNKDNSPNIRQWLYYEKETRRIGLSALRRLEFNIANEIYRLQTAKPFYDFSDTDIEWAIADSEKEQGWGYTDEQRQAIKGCFTNGITIITGSSGCGKTSIMLPVTKLLRRKGILFSQCSLAGKAASNLSEVTHEQGSTIHRLLGYDPVTGCFIKNVQRPLSENVVILDELSMVGAELFYDLIKAIPNGSKLITLGDPNQLEAIGMCNLLKDCVDSYTIPCYHLTKIHRQAQRSAIITDSLKIAEGKQIIGNFPVEETRGELKDFKVVTYADSENSQEVFMREYTQLLNQKIEPKDIMGVVPMRTRGDLSCLSLNKEIQAIVNGDEEKPSLFIKRPDCSYVLRVGDKVVNRKNRYDVKPYTPELPDDCYDGDEVPPTEIFNGNTGYVVEILRGGIVVDFIQQGPVYIKNEYAEMVELGYVLTAHSAQGSQAPYVVVGIDMSAYTLLCKEWLYTSITRARKYCILCGQITAVRKSTQISRVKRKQTWLKEALRQKFSI